MAKKTPTSKKQSNREETLWDAANKLRGSVESSEYKHIVLSLIFLKFISDTFEKQKRNLIDAGLEKHLDMVPAYAKDISNTYHAWRGEQNAGGFEAYRNQAGYCKNATLNEIKANDFVLTPGRYVGAAELEDDGIAFETKMTELSQTLYAQMEEAKELDVVIRKNLTALGY